MGQEVVPIILREGKYQKSDIESLKQKGGRVVDAFGMQLGELFEIDNVGLILTSDFKEKQKAFIKEESGDDPDMKGNWVHMPWLKTLVHIVDEESYLRLRTNRNKNLITTEEQDRLRSARVGITGLSVGGGIAVSLAYTGVGNFHLAEFDQLETANLNRLRSGIQHLGKPKLDITKEQVYEIDPYASIKSWPEGLKESDLGAFLGSDEPLDVVFDEIDDFEMKIRLRIAAKKAGVPVLMFTSLGDNILIDIERYDLEPELQIFNGLLGDLPEEILSSEIGEKEKLKYAMQIVGVEYIPTRALSSLLEMNRSLVGRPQLYSTIAADGGLASYVVKRLVLGWPLNSGRHYVSFDKLLETQEETGENREEILQKLMSATRK